MLDRNKRQGSMHYAYCPVSFMSGKRKKEGDNVVEWMKNSNFTME